MLKAKHLFNQVINVSIICSKQLVFRLMFGHVMTIDYSKPVHKPLHNLKFVRINTFENIEAKLFFLKVLTIIK